MVGTGAEMGLLDCHIMPMVSGLAVDLPLVVGRNASQQVAVEFVVILRLGYGDKVVLAAVFDPMLGSLLFMPCARCAEAAVK